MQQFLVLAVGMVILPTTSTGTIAQYSVVIILQPKKKNLHIIPATSG
jgi:hypothetical protein